jgi:hypothetical protein
MKQRFNSMFAPEPMHGMFSVQGIADRIDSLSSSSLAVNLLCWVQRMNGVKKGFVNQE